MGDWVNLLKLLAQRSFAQMLAYRLSAVFVVIFGTMFSVAEIISVLVFYQFTDQIAGWDFFSFLVLLATYNFVQSIYQFFFVLSHEALMDRILDGELDCELIRPADSQLLCSIQTLDYPSLMNLIIPFGLLVYSWPHLGVPISAWRLILYVGLVVCGVVFYYLLNQFFVTLAFWIERPRKLAGIPEYLFEFASRPRTVYPRVMQVLLSVILPVLTVTSGPADILRGQGRSVDLLSFVGFLAVFGLIVRLQWLAGLRRYASASS